MADAFTTAPGLEPVRTNHIAAAHARTAAMSDPLANDRRVSWALRIVACTVLAVIAAMIVYVFKEAWPSFANNGISWFGSPPDTIVDGQQVTTDQQLINIFDSPAEQPEYTINAWPLLYATILTSGGAVLLGTIFAICSAVYMVEFAPPRMVKILEPVVRLLAAVPSVIYGLIGLLVLVPFIADHLITTEDRESVQYVVQLTGNSLLAAVIVLTIMITPIMIAMIVDALKAVPKSWIEGSTALGVNRFRTMMKISVRAARPAIIAAAVLATGRAIGEAIALSMVSGSASFSPNPLDGTLFFMEPLRPLAATIVENAEGMSVEPFGQTLYAFAAVLLVSTMFLSIAGYLAKRPMRKYMTRG